MRARGPCQTSVRCQSTPCCHDVCILTSLEFTPRFPFGDCAWCICRVSYVVPLHLCQRASLSPGARKDRSLLRDSVQDGTWYNPLIRGVMAVAPRSVNHWTRPVSINRVQIAQPPSIIPSSNEHLPPGCSSYIATQSSSF